MEEKHRYLKWFICQHINKENKQSERKYEEQSQFQPWMLTPWVRCYCPVGMNGDDR